MCRSLRTRPQWLKIRTPDDYTGWIEAGGALKRDVYAVSGTVASVNSLFGSVYRETSITKHQPIFTLPFEARMEVVAEPETEERRWIKVRLPDMREAWIQRGDVSLNPNQIAREDMLAISRRFTGLPYLWGGTSTFGYDCSGFTQMLYRQTGVTLPRDAQPQAEWAGVKASRDRINYSPGICCFLEYPRRRSHTPACISETVSLSTRLRMTVL